jgi:hypothetical protein
MFVHTSDPHSGSRPVPPTTTAAPGIELAKLRTEHLEREIETLAAHINAGSCRWLELVAEFDRREGWATWGVRSCAEWISWRCAIAPRAAREHVRVARCVPKLPLIRDAFRRGELSYSKVRALTRVASADSEADLLQLARNATAAQLDRMVRGFRRVTSEDANIAHRRSYIDWHWDDDGSLCLNGRIPAEDGALFLRALEAAQDALHERRRANKEPDADPERTETENGSAEPDRSNPHRIGESGSAEPSASPRPTHAEAFAALVESALARGPTAIRGGDRYQVVIHADATSLTHDDANGRCQLDDGPSVSRWRRRAGLRATRALSRWSSATESPSASAGDPARSHPPYAARSLSATAAASSPAASGIGSPTLTTSSTGRRGARRVSRT